MSAVYNIYFGKIKEVVDDRSWLCKLDFISQPSLGSEGPSALPLGFISSKVEIDDKVIIFEIDQKPGTYFYIPLKNDSKIGIYNKDTYVDITDPDNLIIQSQKNTFQITKEDLSIHVNGKTYLIHDGEIYLQIKSNMTISGPGQLKIKGIAIPDQTSYPLNTIPMCPMTGIIHGGCTLTLIDTPPIPPTPPQKGDNN